jgi:hypothetical protein
MTQVCYKAAVMLPQSAPRSGRYRETDYQRMRLTEPPLLGPGSGGPASP